MKLRSFLITIFIFSLSMPNLFAVPAQFEKIKELEQIGKERSQERIVRPKAEYNARDEDDPFQRPESKISQDLSAPAQKNLSPSLNVQGLIWGGRFPQAIINNKVVKIGDTIQGAHILSIDKDGVTVSFQEREYKLPSPSASAQPSKKP